MASNFWTSERSRNCILKRVLSLQDRHYDGAKVAVLHMWKTGVKNSRICNQKNPKIYSDASNPKAKTCYAIHEDSSVCKQ